MTLALRGHDVPFELHQQLRFTIFILHKMHVEWQVVDEYLWDSHQTQHREHGRDGCVNDAFLQVPVKIPRVIRNCQR